MNSFEQVRINVTPCRHKWICRFEMGRNRKLPISWGKISTNILSLTNEHLRWMTRLQVRRSYCKSAWIEFICNLPQNSLKHILRLGINQSVYFINESDSEMKIHRFLFPLNYYNDHDDLREFLIVDIYQKNQSFQFISW